MARSLLNWQLLKQKPMSSNFFTPACQKFKTFFSFTCILFQKINTVLHEMASFLFQTLLYSAWHRVN